MKYEATMPRIATRRLLIRPNKVAEAPHQRLPMHQPPSPQTNLPKLIQDNIEKLEEDMKLSIIKNLMPKDFVQGPN
jgi:hypothetical protein